jgi:hypothetical protein
MQPRHRVLGGILGLLVLGGAPPGVRAQTPARDPAAAEALFREGREQVALGNYAQACPKFLESERLDPATGTVFNLAECQERTGKLASSWQNWRKALEQLAPGDSRVAIANARLAALEPRLPHLTLRLAPGAPEDTHVLRDKVDLRKASFGVALPVDPGNHTLTVLADHHENARQTVHLDEAEALTVEVAPGPRLPETAPPVLAGTSPASSPSAPPGVPVESRASTLRTAGWITGGVGAAGFIAAIVTGVVIVEDKSTANSDCSKVCSSMSSGASAVSSGKTMLPLNAVAWGVGIAGVGAGVTMILLAGRKGEPPATVGVSLEAGAGGVTLRGRF